MTGHLAFLYHKYKRIRLGVKKPYNSGQWTKARYRSFIMSALRRAQWPVKYEAIKSSFVVHGVNPATGRKCKLHKCSVCGELFPAKDMRADHINPIVPVTGFDNWSAEVGLEPPQPLRKSGMRSLTSPALKLFTFYFSFALRFRL